MRPIFLLLLLFCAACSSSKRIVQKNHAPIAAILADAPILSKSQVGFLLRDHETGRVVFEKNSQKLFIPASNTKLLTLYAALNLLPEDSLPAYRYRYDSLGRLCLRPLGYPALLHPDFEAWDAPFSFLKKENSAILVDSSNWLVPPYGNGWMWDDFAYAYSAERAALPVFGNTFSLMKPQGEGAEWSGFPSFFYKKNKTGKTGRNPSRAPFSDAVFLPNSVSKARDTSILPIFNAHAQSLMFLEDTLKRPVQFADFSAYHPSDFVLKNGCPRDTLLRLMMYRSDNFLAEQTLLMCAAQGLSDTLCEVNWASDSLFSAWIGDCRWADASGLSRYNLFSPKTLCTVLEKIWAEQGQSRTLSLLPAGGVSGNLHDWPLGADGKPYVYAKSGSMGGVYCLSGFVRTASGRWLTFSIMVNGFTDSVRSVSGEVQRLLQAITAF